MNALRTFWFLCVLALAGCEGGIGGTGTGAPPPGAASPILITGQANKGPFAAGSHVRASRLNGISEVRSASTLGALGRYLVPLTPGAVYQLEVTGPYFSEIDGEVSDGQVTLNAVVRVGTDGVEGGANVNLATHIAHLRIRHLMDSGIDAESAVHMAASELAGTLGTVLQFPVHPLRLGDLVVLNAVQSVPNEEGNAWLLALTALLERAAYAASVAGGSTPESAMMGLCDQLAADFADDGAIGSGLLDMLAAARAGLDPDKVGAHLVMFAFDHFDQLSFGTGSQGSVGGDMASMALQGSCGVFSDEIICSGTALPAGSRHQVKMMLGGMSGATWSTLRLENMVANMNRFIDSDGDGVVNADDDDDDNDGVADADDATPYGE